MIISEIYGVGHPTPMIGLELELEATSTQNIDWLRSKGCMWTAHNDGSLRQNGVEYVLRNPVWSTGIDVALEQFAINTKEVPFVKQSLYGSTHVHYNVGHLTNTEVMSIVIAWSLLEDLVLKKCHPSRTGNLFALRFSDTNRLCSTLKSSANSNLKTIFGNLSVDSWKYSALNLATVGRIGTIEFRCYHSTYDIKEIKSWIDFVCNFCQQSIDIGNPVEVLNFADTNIDKFIEMLMGEPAKEQDIDIVRSNMSTAFRLAFVVPKWEDKNEKSVIKQRPKKPKSDSAPSPTPRMAESVYTPNPFAVSFGVRADTLERAMHSVEVEHNRREGIVSNED